MVTLVAALAVGMAVALLTHSYVGGIIGFFAYIVTYVVFGIIGRIGNDKS